MLTPCVQEAAGEEGTSPSVFLRGHTCKMASPLPARSHRFFSHLRLETKPLTHGLWGVPEDQVIAAG